MVVAAGIPLLFTACAKTPPPDFMPDPGLVSRIAALRIDAPPTACAGQRIPTAYTAILDDGAELPFATSYDEDAPPDLHVVFLSRYSAQATALGNGEWTADPDPLVSAVEGFRLRALLKAKPSVSAEVVVAPTYQCVDHELEFVGFPGRDGLAGGPGPNITVRAGVVSSPFARRLLVAEVTVEDAVPLYVLADADAVPPSDWLRVAAVGGRGGRGAHGAQGAAGSAGVPGCPGGPGGAGGAGGDGEPGADGGTGGHVTVIVPEEVPFLAGLVDAHVEGGPGGPGGRAGAGGSGGAGGAVQGDARRCSAGVQGPAGPEGKAGPAGRPGRPGPRPQIITVPAGSVFGARPRAALQALLAYDAGANR